MDHPLSPRQPRLKALAGGVAFAVQRVSGLRGELALGRFPPFTRLFSRLRDAMVSETLKAVYFPIPKSACTLFATMLALHDDATQDFDPNREGVHRYRFRTGGLDPQDLRTIAREDYFKFTVIRDPFSRLVSAYLDKLVKPTRSLIENDGRFSAEGVPFDLSFEQLVHFLFVSSDHAIEKHWRPQYTFFRNVDLDYVGCFERLDIVFDKINDRFDIDVPGEVAPKVRSAKRTQYLSRRMAADTNYLGDWSASRLAVLDEFPSSNAFYSEPLRKMVAERYEQDLVLHREALRAIGEPSERKKVDKFKN